MYVRECNTPGLYDEYCPWPVPSLALQPNKVANRVFTPLVSSLLGGSLECMKMLIQVVQTLLIFLRINLVYFVFTARIRGWVSLVNL
jgi:hypothetical protein